jgi:hypothetical protein
MSYKMTEFKPSIRIDDEQDRELWFDFVAKVKKQKKRVWEIIKPHIKKYLKNDG